MKFRNSKYKYALLPALALLTLAGCSDEEEEARKEQLARQQAQQAAKMEAERIFQEQQAAAQQQEAEAQQAASEDDDEAEKEQVPESYTNLAGVYCMNTDTYKGTLAIIQEKDKPELHYSFEKRDLENNYKTCANANALVKPNEDGQGWTFKTKVGKGYICTMTITYNDTDIILTEGGKSCKDYCAAGMNIGTMTFPRGNRIKQAVTEEEVNSFFSNPKLCP